MTVSSFILSLVVIFGCCCFDVVANINININNQDTEDIGTFLWLTDTHVDVYYGTSNAEVHKSGAPCASENAPKLSAYGCGASLDLFESALIDAAASSSSLVGSKGSSPDFILFTGDSTRHDTQNVVIQNVTGNETNIGNIVDDAMRIVYKSFVTRFPSVPLVELPSLDLGNNDFLGDYQLHVTSFEPCLVVTNEGDNDEGEAAAEDELVATLPKATNDWLIEVADKFRYVFVDDTEHAVFACGGYMNRRIQNKLRIISLNTVVWSLSHKPKINDTAELLDPFGQMAWLQVQLDAAKKNKEKVCA